MSMGVIPKRAIASRSLGVIAPREDAAVDHRVQRLDAPVHHLGNAGHVRHLDDRHAGLGQGARRAAGRDDVPSPLHEAAGELHEAGSCSTH